jgi:hypothetical protein
MQAVEGSVLFVIDMIADALVALLYEVGVVDDHLDGIVGTYGGAAFLAIYPTSDLVQQHLRILPLESTARRSGRNLNRLALSAITF